MTTALQTEGFFAPRNLDRAVYRMEPTSRHAAAARRTWPTT
ncbi:MAG: hypothetical protein NTZ15_20385 [Burkholderiales bacterium]|nr:hypothetical protein [Burkholderiales bacterium]